MVAHSQHNGDRTIVLIALGRQRYVLLYVSCFRPNKKDLRSSLREKILTMHLVIIVALTTTLKLAAAGNICLMHYQPGSGPGEYRTAAIFPAGHTCKITDVTDVYADHTLCNKLPHECEICGKKLKLVKHKHSPKVPWAGGCRIGLKHNGKTHKGTDVEGTTHCSGSCVKFPFGWVITGATKFIGVKGVCNLDNDRVGSNVTSSSASESRGFVDDVDLEDDGEEVFEGSGSTNGDKNDLEEKREEGTD